MPARAKHIQAYVEERREDLRRMAAELTAAIEGDEFYKIDTIRIRLEDFCSFNRTYFEAAASYDQEGKFKG